VGTSPRRGVHFDANQVHRLPGPADLGISRLAGSLEENLGTWWLIQHSTTVPLQVARKAVSVAASSRRRTAVSGTVTIIVEGQVRRHDSALDADTPPPFCTRFRASPTAATVTTAEALLSEATRWRWWPSSPVTGALPPYDPHPAATPTAAGRLDCPHNVGKRVEHLRTRLTNAAYNLLGENALDRLAEWA